MTAKRNLTIAEAAELTGLSRKAMARRVERGSVRSVLRSSRRLIPRSELIRVGLVPAEGHSESGDLVDQLLSHSVAFSEEAGSDRSLLEVLVRELLDRVQRQAAELAHYRALTAEAASLRLEREVADLRIRLVALEGQGSDRPLALDPPATPEPSAAAQAQRPPTRLSQQGLWLPPQAASALSGDETIDRPLPPRLSDGQLHVSRSRMLILGAEMLFIGLSALLAWFAGLGPVLTATAVGVAWLLAAAFELVRWRA